MSNQIPQEIDALIGLSVAKQQKQITENEDRKVAENISRIQDRFEKVVQFVAEVKPLIPDVILPFVRTDGVDIDDRDTYGCSWNDRILEFHVPGLAPFAMIFDWDRHTEKHRLTDWLVAGVGDAGWDEDSNLCTQAVYSWNSRRTHKVNASDVEIGDVLLAAKTVAEYLPKRQAELERDLEVASNTRQEQKLREEQQRFEEQALFDAIKNDAIAIHMLKAFVLLRDERSSFEQQIYEMDETASSIENRWSRRADELRRQADAAQRKAEDEVSRLQSDLEDKEAELKKVKRGW